ncbi:hypothetical protein J2Z75_005589 [Rhizobium herbae]|uniref:Uncharacterized protein n=1 Tax=Rhizobium herbae TaxID=508661 RepID=A0ABS4EVV4_9HYPH|nr:hypothetical protein [Rhizobium herbae]
MTIDEETGVANVVVWPRLFESNAVSCSGRA